MRALVAILWLFYTLQGSSAGFHYKAEQISLLKHSVIPYEVWDNNVQYRVDYYNGTESDYVYRASPIKNSTHYKIFFANKDGSTKIECLEINEGYSSPVELSFPNPEIYSLKGTVIHNGVKMQFRRFYGFGPHVKQNETIYYYEENVPSWREKILFNTTNGKLLSHIVINYFIFEPEVNQNDLKMKIDENICVRLPSIQSHVDDTFNRYKKHHMKNYSEDEYDTRRSIFAENWRKVKDHNDQNKSYKLALNKFADRTLEELQYLTPQVKDVISITGQRFPYTDAEIKELVKTIPRELDWRIKGKISVVKNQGECGSCWAFAATAAIEAALSIKYGRKTDLSEQFFLDCGWPYQARGCNGGLICEAFELAKKQGVPREAEYGSYLYMNGKCHKGTSQMIKDYIFIDNLSVDKLKYALYKYGPIGVAVYATTDFHLYERGIFNEKSSCPAGKVNHAVLLVGYGVHEDEDSDSGVPYWIVKNSYGEDWGLDGYILISSLNNTANILSYYAFYPLV